MGSLDEVETGDLRSASPDWDRPGHYENRSKQTRPTRRLASVAHGEYALGHRASLT